MKLATIRSDLRRGLSPEQIARLRAGELGLSHSTIYRWVTVGYGEMTNMELRRKVDYQPRRHSAPCSRTTARSLPTRTASPGPSASCRARRRCRSRGDRKPHTQCRRNRRAGSWRGRRWVGAACVVPKLSRRLDTESTTGKTPPGRRHRGRRRVSLAAGTRLGGGVYR